MQVQGDNKMSKLSFVDQSGWLPRQPSQKPNGLRLADLSSSSSSSTTSSDGGHEQERASEGDNAGATPSLLETLAGPALGCLMGASDTLAGAQQQQLGAAGASAVLETRRKPVAADVVSGRTTGRPPPLSRAALNRAKFAIRSYTIAVQAGMPRRSRSLVEDARLETQRNRQLLAEIRAQQQGARVAEPPAPCGELRELKLHPGAAVAAASPIEYISVGEEASASRALAEASRRAEDEASELERQLADFPRHISELDHCNHLLIKYEPELDPTHPGFHDPEYRARRKEVAEVAFNYVHGERIPDIAYSPKECATWRTIYLSLKEAYKRYACEQYNRAIRQLEEAQLYSPDFVPQLEAVSEYLGRKTGWRLRPVAGLLSARDFLASLAFRVFQTSQYIRHWGNPEHSVEPDCIHELMGHIPMLCDPEFAHFSQELGLASLGASDEQIERFATLYWFTVEFGLCREGGQLKCYGAGLLSSYGEMEHALESGKPALREFVPEETAREIYDDSEYQVVYYVADSFEEAKAKMRAYAAANLNRQHELAYDPYTCSIRELK